MKEIKNESRDKKRHPEENVTLKPNFKKVTQIHFELLYK
jgi:hypothetical protein